MRRARPLAGRAASRASGERPTGRGEPLHRERERERESCAAAAAPASGRDAALRATKVCVPGSFSLACAASAAAAQPPSAGGSSGTISTTHQRTRRATPPRGTLPHGAARFATATKTHCSEACPHMRGPAATACAARPRTRTVLRSRCRAPCRRPAQPCTGCTRRTQTYLESSRSALIGGAQVRHCTRFGRFCISRSVIYWSATCLLYARAWTGGCAPPKPRFCRVGTSRTDAADDCCRAPS